MGSSEGECAPSGLLHSPPGASDGRTTLSARAERNVTHTRTGMHACMHARMYTRTHSHMKMLILLEMKQAPEGQGKHPHL